VLPLTALYKTLNGPDFRSVAWPSAGSVLVAIVQLPAQESVQREAITRPSLRVPSVQWEFPKYVQPKEVTRWIGPLQPSLALLVASCVGKLSLAFHHFAPRQSRTISALATVEPRAKW
jgi:hypothetical protein